MKKILFPTEFSNHAPAVFNYAVELAYFFQAQLIMVHAFGKPDVRATTQKCLTDKADSVVDKLIELADNNIPEEYKKEIKIDYHAKVGFPAEAILELATEEEVDLIVMGMTGKTNALETIFGSTAIAVLTKADCQVLAIPEKAAFAGIDNLVYTVNFEFRDFEAINYLKKWSKTFEAPIHCLHMIEKNENETNALKKMMVIRETLKSNKMIRYDLRHGDFVSNIEKFARSKQADIVAMMSHKRNLIEQIIETSTVKGVAKRINIPLLVIKDNAFEIDEDAWNWIQIANSIA